METGEKRLSISTGTIVRFFVILVILLALYYMFDVVLVILAAIVIASSIEPVVRRLRRLHMHRIVAVIFIYIIIAAIVVLGVIFFLPKIITDTVALLDTIPRTISLEALWGTSMDTTTSSLSSAISSHAFSLADLGRGLQDLLVGSSTGVVQSISLVFGSLLSLILILVLSFYLAAREEGVDDFLRIVTPVRHYDYIIDLWKRARRKIGLWLQGQVILGLIVGILVYAALIIIGIPHALLLAVFAGLLEIIPVFGPIISSIPAIVLAFADRGTGIGFLIVGIYLLIHQLENHFFYPLVVKKIVGISPIVVIIALVVGAKLAGVLGALIAVPLAGAFMEYVNDIEKYKKLERAEKAVAKENATSSRSDNSPR